MPTLSVHQAKKTFFQLIDGLQEGRMKLVVITRGGRPVAQLIPMKEPGSRVRFGVLKGQIAVSDDFDNADAEVEQLFTRSSGV